MMVALSVQKCNVFFFSGMHNKSICLSDKTVIKTKIAGSAVWEARLTTE